MAAGTREPGFISLAGPIGAGKTTLAEALGEKLGWPVFREPVIDNELLQDFYADMKAHAFTLQIQLLAQRLRQHHQLMWSGAGKGIQDRSFYEDAIFARVLTDTGDMTEKQFSVYMDAVDVMTRQMKPPCAVVFLDVSPEEALRRIAERGRECEKGITLEYLQRLHAEYRRQMSDLAKTVPVIHIDWSSFRPVDEVAEEIKVKWHARTQLTFDEPTVQFELQWFV